MNSTSDRNNYCTLFDSNYLHKGLALYTSLTSLNENFHLYVLAFDDKCYTELNSLNLVNLTAISLSEFETQELKEVKPTRNRAEYCWTCGPSVIYHFITNYHLNHCTYLDADMMFYSSTKPIYNEIGDNSIAITEHFTEDHIEGRFCVQFVYFKNDENGIQALIWWKNKCIEWCYAKYEDGKFGDQKYLDYFPSLFKKVHVIKHRGAGVAPWNTMLYTFSEFGKLEYNKQLIDIIFFHYHGTRINLIENELVISFITFDVKNEEEKFLYLPYLNLLKSIYKIYFNIDVSSLRLEKRSKLMRFYFKLKRISRHNPMIQFMYYKILKIKYNGYEKNSLCI